MNIHNISLRTIAQATESEDRVKSALSHFLFDDENDLKRLKNELGERIDDECVLHIRFDKQAAYKGVVQLATTTDTIAAQIKLKAYPARRERAVEVAEELF